MLLALKAEIHVFEGVPRWDSPLRLGLELSGARPLRLCERQGDLVPMDREPLAAADFGEGGRVEVHDVTDRVAPALRGVPIAAIRAIQDGLGDRLGIALLPVAAPPFCIWLDGDEFAWGDEAALARSAPEARATITVAID